MSGCLPGWVGASPPSYGGSLGLPATRPPRPVTAPVWASGGRPSVSGDSPAFRQICPGTKRRQKPGAQSDPVRSPAHSLSRAPDRSLQPAPLLEHHWLLPACHCCQGGKICS